MASVDYKQRYQEKWPLSNAREYYIVYMLNTALWPRYRAELVGLGAGSTRWIPGFYHDLRDAFDIVVIDNYDDAPVALVEVTGASDFKKLDCQDGEDKRSLRCIGEWKLEKAEKYGIAFSTWAVFVGPKARDKWQHFDWLRRSREAPFVRKCKIYRDERTALCTPPDYWVRRESFLNWLRNYARFSKAKLAPLWRKYPARLAAAR